MNSVYLFKQDIFGLNLVEIVMFLPIWRGVGWI